MDGLPHPNVSEECGAARGYGSSQHPVELKYPVEMITWVENQAHTKAIAQNAFFNSLLNGEMSREEFARTQRQFFFAVRYFSRPMAALMARQPSSSLRKGLVHNLMEEHGSAEDGSRMDPALSHDLTFVRFLETLGAIGPGGLDREGASVRAFNTSLMGTCLMEPVEMAFGCLGVIEYVFADLSALIGQAVVNRGWINQIRLVHYTLHAEIDRRHAGDFFEVVTEAWDSGSERRRLVEEGVHLGLHVFNRLYEDLWQEARLTP